MTQYIGTYPSCTTIEVLKTTFGA